MNNPKMITPMSNKVTMMAEMICAARATPCSECPGYIFVMLRDLLARINDTGARKKGRKKMIPPTRDTRDTTRAAVACVLCSPLMSVPIPIMG